MKQEIRIFRKCLANLNSNFRAVFDSLDHARRNDLHTDNENVKPQGLVSCLAVYTFYTTISIHLV